MKITQPKELGTLVRTRRQELGFSQTDVAERAGTTRQWLSRFEQGHSDVSLGNAFAILKVLELELGEYVDPSTVVVPQQNVAPAVVQPPAVLEHGEEAPAVAATQGDRVRRLRERDALSGLKGWGSKAKSTAAATAPTVANISSESSADKVLSAESPEESKANEAVNRPIQIPQAGPKYSIDADIARIAKSSLFKR